MQEPARAGFRFIQRWFWPAFAVVVGGIYLLSVIRNGVPQWLVVFVIGSVLILGSLFLGAVIWRALDEKQRAPLRWSWQRFKALLDAGGSDHGRSVRRWTIALFAASMLLGPFPLLKLVPRGWPAIALLIIGPVAAWLLLIFVWKQWRPDFAAEDRFGRAVAGVTAGVLLVASGLATQEQTHEVCTQSVRTRDGTECVGDYVEEPGADYFQVLVLVSLAATAFWLSVSGAAKSSDLAK